MPQKARSNEELDPPRSADDHTAQPTDTAGAPLINGHDPFTGDLPGIEAYRGDLDRDRSSPDLPRKKAEPFALDPPISLAEFSVARFSPPSIVENYLYEDVEAFIAPGGIGKTTLRLKEYVNIALGLDLWGQRVTRPGVCVFITAEDRREICIGRLREVCSGMSLSPAQIAAVLDNIRIHDVSGKSFKLTFVDHDVVIQTSHVDSLIEALRPLAPVVVGFDPAMSFGVGESRVNDAEQGLIEAARRIRNALHCCVQITHHTGKQVARDGIADQYAGRGGSALADGCRMVHVLTNLTDEEWLKATGSQLARGEQGLRLSRPKQSYTPRELSTDIYIVRDGYTFRDVAPTQKPSAIGPQGEDQCSLRAIAESVAAGNKPTQNSMQSSIANLSRSQIRDAIARLLERGEIEYLPLPTAEKRRGTSLYLAPTAKGMEKCADL